MPVDGGFIRALAEISPDLAEQFMREFHRTEILESRPPELEDEPVSTVEQRNSDLFFEIADVLDFYPHLYNQQTWGGFDSQGEPVQLPSGEERDVMLVGVKGCSTEERDVMLVGVRGCATTACLAGWAAALSGWHPTVWTNGDTTTLHWDVVAPTSLIPSDHYSTEMVSDIARALLGITDLEAKELFSGMPSGCSGEHRWTADDLRSIGKGRSVFEDEWPG